MPAENSPARTGIPLWLAALLAVGGVAFGLPRGTELPAPSKPAAPPPAPAPASDPDPDPERDPLLILDDYFRTEPERPKAPAGFQLVMHPGPFPRALEVERTGPTLDAPVGGGVPQIHDAKYEFLIATLPDPVHSPFAMDFDEAVNSLQRAFEARGFTLHSAKMPWPRGPRAAVVAAEATKPPRERPGVILFRKPPSEPGDPERLALVFLVGEHPISGVQQRALTRALEAFHRLREAILLRAGGGWECPMPTVKLEGGRLREAILWARGESEWEAPTVKILGPYYSGSQTSLTRTLEAGLKLKTFNPVALRYEIISGTATALEPKLIPKSLRPNLVTDGCQPIRATVVPNDVVMEAILKYLGQSDRPTDVGERHRVAILRESNTGFGLNVINEHDGVRQLIGRDGLDIPFPLSVWRLQVEAGNGANPAVSTGLTSRDFTEPRLPTPDPNRPSSVTPYDPDAAKTTAGEQLRAIMTAIDRARVRYVGILATDPRDVVFLCKLIRAQCTDARVFTTETSVALAQPDDAYHLRGMVVGSTYPLYLPAEQWSAPASGDRRRLPFSSQAGQGYYNAALALCQGDHRRGHMIGYSLPRFAKSDGHLNRPPVWISVIGEGGKIVPVWCEPAPPGVLWEPKESNTPARPQPGVYPSNLLLAQLSAVGALAGALVLLWSWAWLKARWSGARAWLSGLWYERPTAQPEGRGNGEPKRNGRPEGARRWSRWLDWLWWSAFAAVVLFAVPCVMPLREAFHAVWSGRYYFVHDWEQGFVLTLALVVSVQLVAVFVLLINRIRRTGETGQWWWRWCAAVAMAVVLIGVETEFLIPEPVEQFVRTFPPPEITASVPVAPIMGAPLGVLLAQLAVVGVIAAVLALLGPRAWGKNRWHRWLAGRDEAKAEGELGALARAPMAWFWRGVMLAAVLLFAVPYTLPLQEALGPACCGKPVFPRDWRHMVVLTLAATIAALLVLLAIALLCRWRGPHTGEWKWGYLCLAGLVGVVVFAAWWWWWTRPEAYRFFLYVRATDLPAGLSPLVPMGFLAAAAFAVGLFSLWQADLSRRKWLELPYPEAWLDIRKDGGQIDQEFQDCLVWPAKGLSVLLVIGVPLAVSLFWNVVVIPLPSSEGWWWDWVMRIPFWITVAAVMLTLIRFLTLWLSLRGLLRSILRVPMVGAFERIPDEIARLFTLCLYSRSPERVQLAAAAWALPPVEREQLANKIVGEHGKPNLAWIFLHETSSGPPQDISEADRKWLAGELQKYAEGCLKTLPAAWERRSIDDAFGVNESKGKTHKAGNRPATLKPEELEPWRNRQGARERDKVARQKEQFVACVVTLALGWYFAQLRLLVYVMAVAGPLLLLGAASYPFQPDRPRLDALAGLLGASAIAVVVVLYQLNTDGLVSRITRTDPHRFTPDAQFFSSVATAAAPVLLIVGAQVFWQFRSVLDPLLNLLQ